MVLSSDSEDGTVYHTPTLVPSPTCSASHSEFEGERTFSSLIFQREAMPPRSSAESLFVRQEIDREREYDALYNGFSNSKTPNILSLAQVYRNNPVIEMLKLVDLMRPIKC